MERSAISFHSGDPQLDEGFRWAREQALSYAHDLDPVGPWYEAALPGREAFCMRDVSHQAAGAHFLGLAAHTKNILLRFARGIAESRDWCSFWEIDRYGSPAPVDYTDDQDFWYNLPANFDVLDACRRMYRLTGDRDYLERPEFVNFYDRTVTDYISRWDHDGDGVPDRAAARSRRGIPSYDEQRGMEQMRAACDLIAAQYRAFLSYAELRGDPTYVEKAQRLAALLAGKWWNSEKRRFHGAMHMDGTMLDALGSPHLLAYFDAVPDPSQRAALLDQIHQIGENGVEVELLSHYPEIFFRHGQPDRGLTWLYRLTDPGLARREYPEVSFAAVGAYVMGLMGLSADAAGGTVYTRRFLPEGVRCLELRSCPLFDGSIDLRHDAHGTTLRNDTGIVLRWQGLSVPPGEARAVTIS